MQGGQPLNITVPQGVAPGSAFTAQAPDGSMMNVQCPPDKGPGAVIQVYQPVSQPAQQPMAVAQPIQEQPTAIAQPIQEQPMAVAQPIQQQPASMGQPVYPNQPAPAVQPMAQPMVAPMPQQMAPPMAPPPQPVYQQPVAPPPVSYQSYAQPQVVVQPPPMVMQPPPVVIQEPPPPVIIQEAPPPQVIIETPPGPRYRTETYCGPNSIIVGLFFPCICFCPIDER